MEMINLLKSIFGAKKKHKGRNDRKCNHSKYGPKVSTDGHEVLPSGAIVARVVKTTPKTSKRR